MEFDSHVAFFVSKCMFIIQLGSSIFQRRISHSLVCRMYPKGPVSSVETSRCESSSSVARLVATLGVFCSFCSLVIWLVVTPASTGESAYVPSSFILLNPLVSLSLRELDRCTLENKWPGIISVMNGRMTGRQAFVTARQGSTTVQNTGSTIELLISVKERTIRDCMRMMLMTVILDEKNISIRLA